MNSHENSWQAHFEATHLPHSELTRWAHTVSLLWALHEFATHTVSLLWAIREINRWAHHAVVAVSSLWSHCQPHGETFRWVHVSMALAHTFTGYCLVLITTYHMTAYSQVMWQDVTENGRRSHLWTSFNCCFLHQILMLRMFPNFCRAVLLTNIIIFRLKIPQHWLFTMK